jgi:hypothetical protein
MLKNTDLLEVSKEIGLGVNTEKTKYLFMSHYKNAGQNLNLIANKSFKMWQSSNTWECKQHIEIAFMKKLRAV